MTRSSQVPKFLKSGQPQTAPSAVAMSAVMEAEQQRPGTSNAVSVLSHDIHITGSVAGDGELIIGGVFDGDIRTTGVMVSPGATLTGDIFAERVDIGGRATGKITANHVRLSAHAVFDGEVIAQSLEIEEGAQVCAQILRAAMPARSVGSSARKPASKRAA